MNLRTRFALAFALISVVVAGLVGALSYHAASGRIAQANDTTLQGAATSLAAGQTGVFVSAAPDHGPHHGDGDGDGDDRPPAMQLSGRVIAPDGTITTVAGPQVAIPVTDAARSLATATTAGQTDTTEITVADETYRVLTTSLADGRGATQVALDVEVSHRVLTGMAIEISWVSLAVLVAAAIAGWLLAGRITRRLVRLTGLAEEVSARGGVSGSEPSTRIPVEGRDEVGRLSASFVTMIDRLASSREAQDRLVQDAAHELRTPLTSLRTNTSVLRRFGELSPEAQQRLLADVQGETRELSHLVDELVELALSGRSEEPDELVGLGEVARRAAERARRRSGREITIDDDGSVIRGRRGGLERAIGNLLENAAKFDDSGQPLEVRIERGTTTVRDHGPGIDPADADRVFDRFYRSDAARSLPGSGLGLSMVREVAEGHGGTAFVATPPGGGALVGLSVAADRVMPDPAPPHEPSVP